MNRRMHPYMAFLPVVILALMCATIALAHPVHSARVTPGTLCYSAARWYPAPDGVRPCVTITRLYEDGSFHFRVSDANGTVRYDGGVGALDR